MTGLCFSPGLLRISSSWRLLKLDTPIDFASPASLQASIACTRRKINIFIETKIINPDDKLL